MSIVLEAGSWQNCPVLGSHFNGKRQLRQEVFPDDTRVKNPPDNAGDVGSIPGSGRSSREGNCSPLQYSCLWNPMDRGTQRAVVYGVAKSWTWLTMQTHTHTHTPAYWVFGRSARRLESILIWREVETASWKLPHDYRCNKCYRFWTLSWPSLKVIPCSQFSW